MRAKPLGEFADEVLGLFNENPTPAEMLVQRVHPLRFAEQTTVSSPRWSG